MKYILISAICIVYHIYIYIYISGLYFGGVQSQGSSGGNGFQHLENEYLIILYNYFILNQIVSNMYINIYLKKYFVIMFIYNQKVIDLGTPCFILHA